MCCEYWNVVICVACGFDGSAIFRTFEKFIACKVRQLLSIAFLFGVAFLPLHDGEPSAAEPQNAAEQSVVVRRARIVAAGDLMQHTPQISAAKQSDGRYDYSASFEYVAPYFREADLAIVNLETTLSYDGPYTGYPAFCSPTAVAEALRDMEVDLVALANNHCCDKGGRGIDATCGILDSYGIARTGVYTDSVDYKLNRVGYLKRNGVRFAVVNYTYDTNGVPTPKNRIVNLIDTVAIARDLATIDRERVDCVVALMHWGYEYHNYPNREQRRVADFLQRNGVDLIIGSHPHVVQPAERSADGRITLYSLGNFVSNQRKRYCDGGIVAAIDVEICDSVLNGKVVATSKSYDLKIIPVWVSLPGYVVLPQSVGDTMQMNESARSAYELFISDTKSLLNIE